MPVPQPPCTSERVHASARGERRGASVNEECGFLPFATDTVQLPRAQTFSCFDTALISATACPPEFFGITTATPTRDEGRSFKELNNMLKHGHDERDQDRERVEVQPARGQRGAGRHQTGCGRSIAAARATSPRVVCLCGHLEKKILRVLH